MAVVLVGLAGSAVRFRRDLAAAQRRLDAVERSVVATRFGPVELAEEGAGDPVLVSHGILHGCDGALLAVRGRLSDRRAIAPSRFGYLGSALPPDASSADQADAFVAVLDHLGLDRVDVIAVSAGTVAAVQLALRHPDRIDHLIISSGSFPGSATAEAAPAWATRLYSDPALWTLRTFARPVLARLMGVPPGFPRGAGEADTVEQLLDSIFPVGPRAEGAVFDATVSNPEIGALPLEALQVPTLVVHARDDPLASYGAAVAAAARIPDVTLVPLESGGHLQLGQEAAVRTAIDAFLGERTET